MTTRQSFKQQKTQSINQTQLHNKHICLAIFPINFIFVCLNSAFHPSREFQTRMETSLLTVKGCTFLYSVLKATNNEGLTSATHAYMFILLNSGVVKCLAVELSLPVFTVYRFYGISKFPHTRQRSKATAPLPQLCFL